MFRIEAVLTAPVKPALLQLALHFILRRFPHFATRLKTGLFWHYLEPYHGRYALTPDEGTVCRPIDLSDGRQQLFRLVYRGDKVGLDVFHVLTDGTGALCFLTTLLAEYYRLLGFPCTYDAKTLDPTGPVSDDELSDGFLKIRGAKGKNTIIGSPAVQITAAGLPEGEGWVDHIHFSAKALKTAAHSQGVSVTALLSAMILQACRETVGAKQGHYGLQVPMNLRRVFESPSLRNFSWYCILKASATENLTMEALLPQLSQELRQATQPDDIKASVSSAQGLIRHLRYIPLKWKGGVMRTVHAITGEFFFTTTLSNIGVITLPQGMETRVRSLGFVLGPSASNPYNFTMATLGDDALLTVTRTTADLTLENKLLHLAQAFGLETRVEREEIS